MRPMPEYSRLQIVQALKVSTVEEKLETVRIDFEDQDFGPVFISKHEASRLHPQPGGYMIIDDFARIEYMPAHEFEAKFKRVPT